MKVAVGLSGGVDSAVAAHLLQKEGYEVLGIFLLLKQNDSQNIADAQSVADFLGIELKVLDAQEIFKEKIINFFAQEYLNGRTPNPCIECNEIIKFGVMLDFAIENGCDFLATGHYAKIRKENNSYFLERVNSQKDQSYFLYRLSSSILSKVIFPLAEMEKRDTREIAEKAGIPVSRKKDSLEICFVPNDDYISFLNKMGITSPNGNIINSKGEVLGEHNGIINYTIGQRKGIGAYGKPMFVTEISAKNNTVTIGENGEQYKSSLTADRVSYINEIPTKPFRANVKIRFRAKEQSALITPFEGGFKAEFDEPQRSVTPGQGAVIYVGNTVVGGGRII